jgi:hypothetical protein
VETGQPLGRPQIQGLHGIQGELGEHTFVDST